MNAKDEIYYNVGKFVIEFENMLHKLYETMIDFIDSQSIFSETEYAESLLCELDAMLLVTKFYNLYGIKYEYESDKRNLELIRKIYLRLKCIIEFRNVLVHSSWTFSADTYATDLKKIFGNLRVIDESLSSTKPKKRAVKHAEYYRSIDLKTIKEYIEQIMNTKEILLKLHKYHSNDLKIIIASKRMKRLEKKLDPVESEDMKEITKKILAGKFT